jgi:hypothetical protein
VLGASLPGPDLLEFEEPRLDGRFEGRPLEPLRIGQPRRIDRRQPAGQGPEVPNLAIDGPATEVLQQVVMNVVAVERGARGMNFVQVREVLVDEVRQGFG